MTPPAGRRFAATAQGATCLAYDVYMYGAAKVVPVVVVLSRPLLHTTPCLRGPGTEPPTYACPPPTYFFTCFFPHMAQMPFW